MCGSRDVYSLPLGAESDNPSFYFLLNGVHKLDSLYLIFFVSWE